MKILFTHAAFGLYSGTEIVTRDLAMALHRAGHETVIYSPTLGDIAEDARRFGVVVTDDLLSLTEAPDIIHGHHHQPVMQALLRFPETPAIYLCHDATHPLDTPCVFPRIRKYLAVDERCRARLEQTLGTTAANVDIIPNAVDTDRFQPRMPLPERPRKALLFSNYANDRTHLPAVRTACRRAGIELDVVGRETNSASNRPESILPNYDLVFAKARCALEAMAVGNAVVLCDFAGVGPYVREADFDAMRRKNFGYALLTEPLSADALVNQMARYDAADAAALSARVRTEASLGKAAMQWESVYLGVLSNFDVARIDRIEESHATYAYLSRWHYSRRRDWEREQLVRLQRIPFIGQAAYGLAKWALKRWGPRDE
jgi:glycosyltransferase involved in cell wall biosynthesis